MGGYDVDSIMWYHEEQRQKRQEREALAQEYGSLGEPLGNDGACPTPCICEHPCMRPDCHRGPHSCTWGDA